MKSVAKTSQKIWNISPADPAAGDLAKSLKTSPLLAQVLINRGVSTDDRAHSFLNPRLTELLPPETMPGASDAAKRVQQAIANRQKIAIYGDYDVDGIASTSILWHLINILGGCVEYYIPHRVDEGYGLNESAIRQLADDGTELVITVDCGITAVKEADLADRLGMEMIITDHHQPGPQLPKTVAIVHPGIDTAYSNPDSAGAMVAFKLAWAIVNLSKSTAQTPPQLREFLLNATTLAAMGTIADVVNLRGENRILTSFGLKSLAQTKMPGLRALIDLSELSGELDSYHIAFKLAPMLNAAGRMGHARLAVDLLTSENQSECIKIAMYLKEQNKLRQQCQRKIYKEARTMIIANSLNSPDKKSIVIASDNWHTGVIGIVASRIVEEYNRPTVILSTDGDLAQGSGRSVAGFDLFRALDACSEHLVSFGGHAMAAGLKLEIDRIADFINAFENYAQSNLDDDSTIAKLDIDAICRIEQLNFDAVKHLQMLEPFGQGNPAPVFATRGVHRISPPRCVGVKNDHLQVAISDNTASVRCIGFGMGRLEKKILESDSFSIAYEPQFNTYNGNTNVQFLLKDIQFE